MNNKLQVLVIDDDAVVGRSFDRVLSEKGYEVSTAMNGEEALHTMEEHDFDLVFTDIKMPGMDGLEVTERIKERCPWTPVVVITGYGSEDNENRASVLGASGFVRKPLTPEIIESITLKALTEDMHIEQALEPTREEKPAKAHKVAVEASVQAEPVTDTSGARSVGKVLKSIGLFFAAPFVALSYVIALPFVGFYMFAKLGYEAYTKRGSSV